MIAIAQITDTRAALAVGTVKKRIRMCGRPAVPNTSAMPSEIWSIGALNSRPGSRKRWPSSAGDMFLAPSPRICATRACTLASPTTLVRKSPKKPYCIQTMTTSTMEAVTSSAALMICTHVVATMPPNST